MANLNPIDPFAAFQQGYGIGGAFRQNREARLAAEAAAARQAQEQQLFNTAMDSRSVEDWNRWMSVIPKDRYDQAKTIFDSMTADQQQSVLQDHAETAFALRRGDIEFVQNKLSRELEAAKNAGDARKIAEVESEIGMLEDPKALEGMYMSTLITLPGAEDIIGNLEAMERTESSQQARELELITKGVELNLPQEELDRMSRLAEIFGHDFALDMLQYAPVGVGGVAGAPITPAQKYEQTLKLYDRYQKRVGNYQDSLRSHDTMKTSAAADTGQGDLALIFQFMRMLDPGSVVRESEYAAAQDTGGLYEELLNLKDSWTAGQKLQPGQRKRYLDLAQKYMDAASAEEKRAREDIGIIADNWQIPREEVFGTIALEDSEAPPEVQPTAISETTAPVVTGIPTQADLAKLADPRALSFAQAILKDERALELTTQEEWNRFLGMSLEEMQDTWKGAWARFQSGVTVDNTNVPIGELNTAGRMVVE